MARRQQYSGFLGDCSAQQEQTMREVIAWVHETATIDMELLVFDESDILRFCRARKFDLDKVKVMLQNFAEWRRRENVDTLLDTFRFPGIQRAKQLYPHGIHKVDNEGRPIWIERPGVADIDAVLREFDNALLLQRIVHQCEWFKIQVYPACSRVTGRKVEETCQIFDLADASISKLCSRNCMNFLKLGAQVVQDYFPETLGVCYVVNAPRTFMVLWSIVKGFLDERTRSKIRILRANSTQVLLENIPADNLPSFLGGNCSCPEVEGGCLYSGAGPWNDYEIVNRRIVHRSELEEDNSTVFIEEENLPRAGCLSIGEIPWTQPALLFEKMEVVRYRGRMLKHQGDVKAPTPRTSR